MRSRVLILLYLFAAPLLFAATPRVTFERIIPAPHDLGRPGRIAIVKAPGGTLIDQFVERFVEQTSRSGILDVVDSRGTAGAAAIRLELVTFKCDTATREIEGTVRRLDGSQVKRRLFAVDAVCMARIDVLSAGMRRLSSFYAKGEGSSLDRETISPDQREDALRAAVRIAAVNAAERITPRRVRESVLLDERSPAFSDALPMIESDRLAEARTVFESALQRNPRSAPLRYNLGALYEALGDRRSAERHYTAAKVLAPNDPRYAMELKRFVARGE